MAILDNIFKYKKQVVIKDPNTDEESARVWVRLLGDEDLKDTYKMARIASAATRAELRDATSIEYKDTVAQMDNIPNENLIIIVTASRERGFEDEASLIVIREDIPTLETVTSSPDAPSLEDQERLDKLIAEQDERYQKALKGYVDTRMNELKVELEAMTHEDLVKEAKGELANLNALQSFTSEVQDQRGYRGTFEDEACTVRAFSSLQSYKNASSSVKDQISEAYASLELPSNELKN